MTSLNSHLIDPRTVTLTEGVSGFSVTWAQRSSDSEPERNYLYVNLKTPDVPKADAKLSITPTNVSFTGASGKGVTYSVSLDLYAEIDPENSKVNHTDREVELVLRKKELKLEYWPRLLKDSKKVHFLKTDFDKVSFFFLFFFFYSALSWCWWGRDDAQLTNWDTVGR